MFVGTYYPCGDDMVKQFQEQNIGPLDRISRIVIGLVMIGSRYAFKLNNVWGDWLVIFGAIGIWEALLGYCLGYGFLGWSTRHEMLQDNREGLG